MIIITGSNGAEQPNDQNPTGNDLDKMQQGEPIDRVSELQTPVLDQAVQSHIGRQLRNHYAALVSEQVPDNLLKLLDQLAQTCTEKKDNRT